MRWLMIGLLVSLAVLLFAAGGLAVHILLQRARLRRKPQARNEIAPGVAEETDIELEP
jgi:anaerobic C4-dicarboxylate transporter